MSSSSALRATLVRLARMPSCRGCGATLQTTDAALAGFVPLKAMRNPKTNSSLRMPSAPAPSLTAPFPPRLQPSPLYNGAGERYKDAADVQRTSQGKRQSDDGSAFALAAFEALHSKGIAEPAEHARRPPDNARDAAYHAGLLASSHEDDEIDCDARDHAGLLDSSHVEDEADYAKFDAQGQTSTEEQQRLTKLYASHQNREEDQTAGGTADAAELGGSRSLLKDEATAGIKSSGHDEAAVIDMCKDEDSDEDNAEELELALMQNAQRGRVVCQRCSQLRNKGRLKEVRLSAAQESDEEVAPGVAERVRALQKPLVILIADARETPAIHDHVILKSLGIDNPRQHALHLVLNKADLLPSAAQKPSAMNLIRGRVRKGYHQLGFADCNVSLVSAKTGFGVHSLFADLFRRCTAEARDIVIVGRANVGKTSILNLFIPTKLHGTVSPIQGTTLGANYYLAEAMAMVEPAVLPTNARSTKRKIFVTARPFPGLVDEGVAPQLDRSKNVCMMDTPGYVSRGHASYGLSMEELKIIEPSRRLAPRMHVLQPGQALAFGGMAWIELLDFDGAETAKVVVYASEKLGLHVTKSAEIAHKRAMQRAGRDNCRPPCGTENTFEFTAVEADVRCSVPRQTAQDLVLTGLGWVNVYGRPGTVARFRVHKPENLAVQVRPALLSEESPHTVKLIRPSNAIRTR